MAGMRTLQLAGLVVAAIASHSWVVNAEDGLAGWQGAASRAAAAAAERASRDAVERPADEPSINEDAAGATSKPTASGAPADAKPGASTKTPPAIPAKTLFGAATTPSPLAARAIGGYAKGCLAGAQALAIDGPAWQAMRLSRNRNWGHPQLISLLERFAKEVQEKDGWPGLLIGDISQPRGGPMLTGHSSHQLGLDADVWFTPMPARRLTKSERENLSATSMLAADNLSVNPKVWGEGQVKIIRRVASYQEVERVLVHPAIKKALCEAAGSDRSWLNKVRPIWGHYYHFHIRMGCPAGSVGCVRQAPPPSDDGCGKELDDWYKLLTAPPPPKPTVPVKPPPPKPPLTMADLPADCRTVLESGETASQPDAKNLATGTAGDNGALDAPKPQARSN